jgi:hypothetical protein
MKNRLFQRAAALAAVLLLTVPLFAGEGDELLEQAKTAWSAGRYQDAADAYRNLRDRFPDHPFVASGDAQFWLWCSLGPAGKDAEQIVEIERFLKDYPKSRSCGYALFFLGAAYDKTGNTAKAKEAWKMLLKEFPDDEIARHAKIALEGGASAGPQVTGNRVTLGDDFIDYARGAATWLESVAVAGENGGLKWLQCNDAKAFSLNFYDGASGVCLFYLNMFRVTGDAKYRALAEMSAAPPDARALKDADGFFWEDENELPDGTVCRRSSPALYSGASGLGSVFLRLHEVLGGEKWLDLARGAADRIAAGCEKKSDMPWGENTDVISGAAGIGLFMLEIHAATGKKRYLDCAKTAGEWLVKRAVKDGDGLKWRSMAGLERFYTGFSHGTAGIVCFLARLSEAGGDKDFLDAAEAGAAWLVKNAVAERGGLKWFHYGPENLKEFMSGWCHGPAGTCRMFLELHRMTGKAEYLDIAKKGAAWLMLTLEPSKKETMFHGLSMCCGAAGGKLDIMPLVPGAPEPQEDPMRGGGANRLLYGDPACAPFASSGTEWLKKTVELSEDGGELRVNCAVLDETAPVFWDMFGGNQEKPEAVVAVVEIPKGFDAGGVLSVTAELSGAKDGGKLKCLCAVELVDGKMLLHLKAGGAQGVLEKKGAVVLFTVRAGGDSRKK